MDLTMHKFKPDKEPLQKSCKVCGLTEQRHLYHGYRLVRREL